MRRGQGTRILRSKGADELRLRGTSMPLKRMLSRLFKIMLGFGRNADAYVSNELVIDSSVSPIRPAALPVKEKDRHEILDRKPSLSIVIGSYNRKPLLAKAIASVRRELEGLDGEIIVVDGGSTDGTIGWLVEQQDIISLIQHNRYKKDGHASRRKSWGEFMNLAFRAAAGDYIIMISDDCLLLEGAIRNGLDRIAQVEKSGVKVGGCAFYFRNWPMEDRYYVQRTIGGNLMVNHGFYKKEALEAVGWADENNYVFYKADTDLSLKIWAAGYAIIDSKESICEHYVGEQDEVRQSNNALMDHDRQSMCNRWPDLVTRDGVAKMGKIFLDLLPNGVAEKEWSDILRGAKGEKSK